MMLADKRPIRFVLDTGVGGTISSPELPKKLDITLISKSSWTTRPRESASFPRLWQLSGNGRGTSGDRHRRHALIQQRLAGNVAEEMTNPVCLVFAVPAFLREPPQALRQER
jgi:hypothetical protein